MNATLPLITQIMVAMGKVAPVAIPLVIVGLIAIVSVSGGATATRTSSAPGGSRSCFKAPVFGKLNTNVALARFCNNFSSMLASGVPIVNALDIVGSTSGNYVLDTASKRVSNLVNAATASDSMASENVFFHHAQPNGLHRRGFRRHRPDARQRRQSLDEEAQSMAKQLTSLLEPLMILVLGVVVGFMVLGLYMPMFSMFDAMNAAASTAGRGSNHEAFTSWRTLNKRHRARLNACVGEQHRHAHGHHVRHAAIAHPRR